MSPLEKTQNQLKELGYPSIGIELKDGSKKFGKVTKFTRYNIYLRDRNGDELDVPRRIITRVLLCIDGGESIYDQAASVSK